jgi:pilus assembly protein CpaE
LKQTIVGILSPSSEMRELLRSQFYAANIPNVDVEGEKYIRDKSDQTAHKFSEAQPQIILVDIQDPDEALQSLRILHDLLPETWLFVSSSSNDSQLVIDTMRAGAREFLAHPVTLQSLSKALARYFEERQKSEKNKAQGKVYCVTAAKGGTGTTSVAINLATSVATSDAAKVALIDLSSPMGDTAEYLNLKAKFTVSDAIAASTRLDPVLLESYMTHSHKVAVLPGIREFPPRHLHTDEIARILQVASETYTHTFVDVVCPHDQDQLESISESSTAVIIVLTPELPALWRTDRLIQLFQKYNKHEKLRLVINRDSKRSEISIKEMEKSLGHSIYWSLPNNYPAAIGAVNSGKPLVSVNHSSLASSYIGLAEMLTSVPLRRKKRHGIFSLNL